MENAAAHIRENAIAYSVCYEDENTIDEINIRQATHKAMKRAIFDTHLQLANLMSTDSEIHISDHSVCTEFLLVDGNDFTPFTYFDETQNKLMEIPHTTIEGGDNKFTPIAAASILAKYERDLYITNLCEEYPMLKERYGLDTNKGYGTKIHMDGIKAYGITKWHRKTFGICQEYATKLKKDSQKKEKKTQQKEKKK